MFDKSKEELLAKQENRFTFFPIKYQDIFDLYKKSIKSFWTVEEVDFSQDRADFNTLNDNEKSFIKYILAFFAASDGIVNENLVNTFSQEIEYPEIRGLYAIQSAVETIHCVSADTMVKTKDGNVRIGSLKDKRVEIDNGYMLSEVVVRQTNEKAPLLEIELTDGRRVKTTHNHAWIVYRGGELTERVRAQHLQHGMAIFEPNRNNDCYACIKDIKPHPIKMDVYCFSEPYNHTGIFNDIYTGQSETYSMMIDSLIEDEEEKAYLFNAVNNISVIQKKADWALKYITNGDFNERLLAFIIVEGVFFSGSFCSIYWIKQKNKMPGLTTSNEFISRDEALHCRTGIALYNKLNQKLSQEKVHNIMREAITLEDEFINEILKVELIGMNKKLMSQYIKFVADYWLNELGYEKIYKVSNPFSFMDYISIETKADFFNKRITAYQRADTTGSFDTDVDF